MSYVIVQFDPYAKTGNRLCQFAFGKKLADIKKVPFYSNPIPGFPNTYKYTGTPDPQSNLFYTLNFGAHYVDYEFLVKTEQPVCINSYLQKIFYYERYLKELQNLFLLKNKINIDKDELVIHIRDTDYRNGNVHIREHVYFDILNRLSPSKASIVTDNINSPIVQTLCGKGVKIKTECNITNNGDGLNNYELNDYLYMLNASQLLISQSTFSWWAAFLGYQERVYVPYDSINQGMWKINPEKDDIDLVPSNNKFVKLIV